MKRTIILLSIISLLFQTSCKKATEKYINVNGTVLNEQTNIPINGLNVSLSQANGSLTSGGGWTIIATETTDDNGKFSFNVKVDAAAGWKVDINSNPYSSKYSTYWFSVNTDTKYDSIIYIYRTTTLTVTASTDYPLGPNDSFSMNLPGIGCNCDNLTSTRAKGNAFNLIKWTVTRNNITNNYSDSIYCPVDTITYYEINY